MIAYESPPKAERSIAAAIRAVEQLSEARRLNGPHAAERQRFFELMNGLSAQLFAEVAVTASEGKRSLHPAKIVGFKEGCARIFGLRFGLFDVDLLNDWLHARDVRHMFWATEQGIHW